jgi:hypothetical protein
MSYANFPANSYWAAKNIYQFREISVFEKTEVFLTCGWQVLNISASKLQRHLAELQQNKPIVKTAKTARTRKKNGEGGIRFAARLGVSSPRENRCAFLRVRIPEIQNSAKKTERAGFEPAVQTFIRTTV